MVGRGSRRTLDQSKVSGIHPPNGMVTPLDAPSRGLPLGYGSARLQASLIYWSGFNCFPLMDCSVFREPRPTNYAEFSNDALQMLIKKLDRAFLDLYPQRGVQHHVGRTGDRQESEWAARFFESIHQFEAVPKIDVVIRSAVDQE
jgi:hypothetical protein